MIEKINKSYFGYGENHVIHTREYYMYCVWLVKNWLLVNDYEINVILGNYSINFENQYKTIRIDIQCEHTLVKEGGRSVTDMIYGSVKHDDGNYLVRIANYSYFNSIDLVIEYSLPNIFNIASSGHFNDYMSKVLYVAPMLYNIDFDKTNKTDIITLFTKDGNHRRAVILSELETLNIPNKTIENCFSYECLLDLYKRTKIMVNVHQTDHHHTFEELRVLPALLNGVIIISEEVPLLDKIPYGDYIVWAKYGDLANKTLEVSNNYMEYYNKLFVDGNLKEILSKMKADNIQAFNNLKYEGSFTNSWVS